MISKIVSSAVTFTHQFQHINNQYSMQDYSLKNCRNVQNYTIHNALKCSSNMKYMEIDRFPILHGYYERIFHILFKLN